MWSDAAREASIAARKGAGRAISAVQGMNAAAHQSKVYEALHKDRFTGLVPPGSKRDFVVKQAAEWSKAGLEKMAIMAAGGGAVGVAGMAVANYTKWGGALTRKFGPKIAAKVQAIRANRAAVRADRASRAGG